MREQINLLRQLQELVLTRDEHHQLGDGSHLDELNDAIDALEGKLDPKIAEIYNRLYKKSHITVAAMSKHACSVCGMQVPIASAQQVMLGEHLVACSNCGRLLYCADAEAQGHREKGDKDDPPKGISRFSCEQLMMAELPGNNRVTAITALALLMEKSGFVTSAQALAEAVFRRETTLSTAMGNGIAFPHARGIEGGALTLALGVSRDGIDWNGEKVHIVILSAIPLAVSAFYLRLVAGLAQSLEHEENRAAILAAKDSATLWKVLGKATRATIK